MSREHIDPVETMRQAVFFSIFNNLGRQVQRVAHSDTEQTITVCTNPDAVRIGNHSTCNIPHIAQCSYLLDLFARYSCKSNSLSSAKHYIVVASNRYAPHRNKRTIEQFLERHVLDKEQAFVCHSIEFFVIDIQIPAIVVHTTYIPETIYGSSRTCMIYISEKTNCCTYI